MASSQLPNYLRANRKRLALSQDEVAFLLGTKSGAKISRYERFDRNPNLETALAFEVIFQRPMRELFSGIYQKVKHEVASRAKTLNDRENNRESDQQSERKRQVLTTIAGWEPDRISHD